jgi:hypothetical protein
VEAEEEDNSYRILVGKPEIVALLRRIRRRWEDNNKMNLRFKNGGALFNSK